MKFLKGKLGILRQILMVCMCEEADWKLFKHVYACSCKENISLGTSACTLISLYECKQLNYEQNLIE